MTLLPGGGSVCNGWILEKNWEIPNYDLTIKTRLEIYQKISFAEKAGNWNNFLVRRDKFTENNIFNFLRIKHKKERFLLNYALTSTDLGHKSHAASPCPNGLTLKNLVNNALAVTFAGFRLTSLTKFGKDEFYVIDKLLK